MNAARMKSFKRFALSLVSCALLTGTALYAEFDAGYYAPARTGSIRQTLPFAAASGATYEVGTYPLFAVDLASGDGKTEVASYCNTCHSPRYITMQPPLPAETWAAEVEKMTKTHGASIPDDAKHKIILYLQAHYTPETRKN